MEKMKSISGTNCITGALHPLLLLTLLLSCVHLSLEFPSSHTKLEGLLGKKASHLSEKYLPSPPPPPFAITSAIKPPTSFIPNNNPPNSRGIEFPSQSKSESTSKPKWLSQQPYYTPSPSTKNNFTLHENNSRNSQTLDGSDGGVQLSPPQPSMINAERQIGNPISLDLHEKVNVQGEGEEVKVGGIGVRVTDVNPKFGFEAGSWPGLVPSIHLLEPRLNARTVLHDDNAHANSDTNTAKKNVNVDLLTDNNITKLEQTFVIKALSQKEDGERDGESRTQFSQNDNNKNKTETNRTYIHPADGPEQNSKVGIVPVQQIQTGKKNEKKKIGGEDTPIDTIFSNTWTKNTRFGSGGGGGIPERKIHDGDLYLEQKENSPIHSCIPIIVNQTQTQMVLNYGKTTTTTTFEDDIKDMDKWTRTLVKMSQCVATCFGKLSFNQKNMSPEKGINELGGSGRSSFPMGITALGPNYNGDINRSQQHFDDKLLSTCQKSCKFLPQKSASSPISITKHWKQTEQTNKVNDASSSPSFGEEDKEALSKSDGVYNHGEMSGVGKVQKNDEISSVSGQGDDAKKKTTTTQFLLHWPKVISWASSIKNKSPSVILYNVMVQEEDETLEQHLLPPRWKLIDQTVAQQTQISLRTSDEPCSIKPKSHHRGSPQETIILDELHDHSPQYLVAQYGQIPLKVMAIGQGLEKVFFGLVILTSPSSSQQGEKEEDKSKSTLESTCCQSSRNGEMQHFHKKGISNPKRNSDVVVILSGENKNSNNVSNPDSLFVVRSEGSNSNSPSKQQPLPLPHNFVRKKAAVMLNGNKNSGIASNKINFKRSSSNKTGIGGGSDGGGGWKMREVSYKVESDPSTRGKIDTTNHNSNEGKEEDANSKSTTELWHDSLRRGGALSKSVSSSTTTTTAFTTKSQQQAKPEWSSKLNATTTTSASKDGNDDWGLTTVSMVYQNFLVVTEVRWNVPGVVSNQEQEKNAFGSFSSSDKNNNAAASTKSSNSVSETESGDSKKKKTTNYLLTWEILGGGLKGNLVTECTSGTISLWPDTAYFIQVGLIDPDTSTGTPSSSSSFQEQEQHQNYMSNLLGMESIIFPLAGFSTGEPKLTLSSLPLLVNTSSASKKLSIPKSSPSPSLSQRSRNLQQVVVTLPKRNDKTSRHKSNNPPWQGEKSSGGGSGGGKYLHFQTISKVGNVENGNVRPITIPSSGTVSTNGNENSNGHLSKTKNKNVRPSSSSSSSDEVVVGDHQPTVPVQPHDHVLKKHKKYYGKNYIDGDKESEKSSQYIMMGDSPGGKSLLVRGNDDEFEGDNEKFHGHPQMHRYLVGASNLKTNFTSTANGYEDKTANINDNKSNNNLKEKNTKKKASSRDDVSSSSGGDHHNNHHHEQHHDQAAYRPEGYQGLFALNLGLGGYNYNYDHNDELDGTLDNENKFGGSSRNNGTNGSGDTGASVIYSVFVLIVVACVIFLFLVAFIGFFVVSSSITQTAHYFIPKKLRIWVIGENSESELLAGNGQDVENEQEAEFGVDNGRFIEDLDDDVPEWGDDIGEGDEGQEVGMTHRDIGRT